jgi:CPA2 family monovalent cation:H+ antiporter-2
MAEELGLLVTMAVVLGVALVGGMVARVLKLPIILGYLVGGIVIGPYGLGVVREVGDVERWGWAWGGCSDGR